MTRADRGSNLFAEKTFDTQIYDMAQNLHLYKDYAAGKLTRKASEANPPHTVMRILRRGRSRRADKFLDWLVSTMLGLIC